MRDVRRLHRRAGLRSKEGREVDASESSAGSITPCASLEQEGGEQTPGLLFRMLHGPRKWTARARIRPPIIENRGPSFADITLTAAEGRNTPPSKSGEDSTTLLRANKARSEFFAPDLPPPTEDNSAAENLLGDLFNLLESEDPEIGQKTLTTIFHLAKASVTTRNLILGRGGLNYIVQQIQRDGPAELATAGAIYHLTSGQPLPPYQLVESAFPLLLDLLYRSNDAQVVNVCCHVLYELTTVEDPNASDFITRIIPVKSHLRLAELADKHNNIDVQYRAMLIINRIALADRMHGPRVSRSHCGESFITEDFLSTLKWHLLNTPETQDIALELIQNLLVNHRAAILIAHQDLLRVYFETVRQKIGFEYQVLSSLLPALRDASPNEVLYLNKLGGADVTSKCLRECEKLVSCLAELQALERKLLSKRRE